MSNIEILGKAGPQLSADGTLNNVRLGKTGEMVVGHAHGRYYESAVRGNLWTLSTAAAGVTVAAANVFSASAGSPIVWVFNPVTSGKNMVITRANLLVASGTLGAGGFVWGFIAPNAGVTAAGGNGAINNQSFLTGGSIAKTFTGSALTGAGAGSLLRFVGGPTTGAAAANQNLTIQEDTQGDLICPPGGVIGIFAAAAGTSPIVMASMTWEEVPIS
jgi:hypothetical protein